jgi:hypothetical protein
MDGDDRWNAEHGYSKSTLEMFEQMCHVGLKLDHVAFTGVLSVCCHAGKSSLD